MLAGIEFGLLHLFPHRVNAFKDMVYFSNGETLFSETFIRFLPIPLTSLSKKIGLYMGVGEKKMWGSSFLGGSGTKGCWCFPGRKEPLLALSPCELRGPGLTVSRFSFSANLNTYIYKFRLKDCRPVSTPISLKLSRKQKTEMLVFGFHFETFGQILMLCQWVKGYDCDCYYI